MLIAGAGMAGLVLARALRQRGITAEVVERVTESQPGGAGGCVAIHRTEASSEPAKHRIPGRRDSKAA